MKKIILNKDYGGFGVSPEGYRRYAEKKGLDLFFYEFKSERDENGRLHAVYKKISPLWGLLTFAFTEDFGDEIRGDAEIEEAFKAHLSLSEDHRDDPVLVEVVEELGDQANTPYSNLKVVEIPDDVAEDYVIDNYDGCETLHKRVEEY